MTAGNIPPKGPDEDAWQPDAESLNALEAEIPILAILRSFAVSPMKPVASPGLLSWVSRWKLPSKTWPALISMGWAIPMPRPHR